MQDPPGWFSQREQKEIGAFLLTGGILVITVIGLLGYGVYCFVDWLL